MSDYQYCKSSVLQILKQPLSNTEYRKLEKNLINNGCSEPLLVWDKYVIDGVKRYEICKTYGISYTTKHKNFREMIDAVSYICEVQLERYDLTVEMRKYLIGRNCYIDTSSSMCGLSYDEMARLIRAHGTKRVLFGTDYPLAGAKEELGRFMNIPLTESEREDILYGNAARLLGISL